MATADTRAADLLLEAQTAAQAHCPGDTDMAARGRLAFQVGWLQQTIVGLCIELEHAGAFDTVEHRDEPDRDALREADEWRREARNFARESGAAGVLRGPL